MKKRLTKFAQVAGIMLALVFTFSCSSDDGGGNNGGSSGGGSNTQGGCPNATTGNGTLSCGGQTYKTVPIGSQIWMAENLNYIVSGSKCYGDGDKVRDPSGNFITLSPAEIQANCTTYGRLYNWTTAMVLPDSCGYGDTDDVCGSLISAKHRGICPSGWHIPSEEDLNVLMEFIGSSYSKGDGWLGAGTKLKAKSGWNNNGNKSGNGTDDYNFLALPGGMDFGYDNPNVGDFVGAGESGYWWSSSRSWTKRSGFDAIYIYMSNKNEDAHSDHRDMNARFSIRCVKD